MKCPFCGSLDTQVIDSRVNEAGDAIRRRRRCTACDKRFSTRETAELRPPQIVKTNGTREDFSEIKLLEGFRRALHERPVSTGLVDAAVDVLNSIYLTVPATIISSLLGSLNGYVLSKWKFRGASPLFWLMLFGMFIPYQSIVIPLTQTLAAVGLGGTLWGLILVHVVYGIPITTLIFRNYYATIPNEMLEAARIDGGNIFSIYRYIMLPLSPPAFVVVLIWQFTNIWNDFIFAVTIVQNQNQPMTVALNNIAGSFTVEWNVQINDSIYHPRSMRWCS